MQDTSNREIIISRTVSAPRDLVWQVWTEPKHLEQWWGPNGFTVTTESIDIRVGGTWKFLMHGPDGTDYPNVIVFTEIAKPERISHDHGDGTENGIHFKATITFEEEGKNKTRITMKSVFPTQEARDHVVKEYGAIEGGKQTLGRMADYVEKM